MERSVLEIPAGYRSVHVARMLAQLDEQTRRLVGDTRDLPPAALAWQQAPGMNTIGMLLAHIAISEAHLTDVIFDGRPNSDTMGVLGLGTDDDAMPLPPGAGPPAHLSGKPIGYFHELLTQAREHTRAVTLRLGDEDLARQVTRPSGRVFSLDWALYHLLEHEAGHHYQINLLRHLHSISAAS
jgi:hypothetical protein